MSDSLFYIIMGALILCGFGAHMSYVDPMAFRNLEDEYVEGIVGKDVREAVHQKRSKKKNRMKTFLGIGAIILTVGYYLYTDSGMNSILFLAFVFCTIGAIFISVNFRDYMILFRKRMKNIIDSDIALAMMVEALDGQKSLKYSLTAAAVILGWILFL